MAGEKYSFSRNWSNPAAISLVPTSTDCVDCASNNGEVVLSQPDLVLTVSVSPVPQL